MTAFRIECEFESGHGIVAEHRATWARIEIWIDSECVTRFEDLVEQELRNGIRRPLYPVAEWFLGNWWSILYEPHHNSRRGYWRRHNLRAAEEGFALPNLEFVCFGDVIELRWSRHITHQQMTDFVSSGVARIARDEVRNTLLSFVERVVHRLKKRKIRGTFVDEEFEAIQKLMSDEHVFCRAAGAMGVDPFDMDEPTARQIENATTQLPPELHDELFAVADPERLQQLVDWVNQARCETVHHAFDVAKLRSEARPRTTEERIVAPAKSGYARARQLRDNLRLPMPGGDGDLAQVAFPLDSLSDGLDDLATQPQTRPSLWIDSLGDATAPDRLLLSTGKKHVVSRRFAIARAIGDFLALDARGLFVIPSRDSSNGDVSTARQQFNRAFAAELLAPAESLADRIGSTRFVSDEQIGEWAEELQVSEMVINWQLHNHHLVHQQAT